MITKNNLWFIHGWGYGPAVWDDFRETYFSHSPIYCPNLFVPNTRYGSVSNKQYYENVITLIAGQLQENTVVVGWSMGGLVAIDLVRRYQEKFKSLVLLNSAPRFVADGNWKDGIDKEMFDQLVVKFKNDPGKTLKEFCGLISQGESKQKELVRYLDNILIRENTDRTSLLSWLELLSDTDLRECFKSLQVPIYILLTENDVLVKHELKDHLQKLNRECRIKIVQKCGHAPFISRPDVTAEYIQGAMA